MNARERTAPPDRRLEYHWDADRDAGFEKSTFIYDSQGRLIAVDYATRTGLPPQPVTPPR